MLFKPLTLIVLLAALDYTSSANILFFFGLSTYSHRIAVWPLVEKLAERGHQVTFVQPFNYKGGALPPNITEFYPSKVKADAEKNFEGLDFLQLRLKSGSDLGADLAAQLPAQGIRVCGDFLRDPETKKWMDTSKFDLVVIDALMNECGFGLAYKFKAKTIIFGTSHPFFWTMEALGVVVDSSTIPELHHSFQLPMSLSERLQTTMWAWLMYYGKVWSMYPELDKIFRSEIDSDIPSVQALEKQTSLVLQNSHFSEELARSLPPMFVSVAGMYCVDSKQKLSKDLEDFINNSDGFVYVSFGSAANIAQAPIEFQKIFHDVMRDSKLKFVWKYDGERPRDLSPNVYTAKWMPQMAVLSHPKVRAFVSHGGLLGMHEAVWNAVPMVVMPVFAEQDFNAMRVQRTQRGVMLDVSTLTRDKFLDALQKVIKDPKYKLNMQRVQRQFKDRPDTAVNTAVWWTEYVLRTDEADLAALKPLTIHQHWIQYRLLDVYGVLFAALLLLVIMVKKTLGLILGFAFRSKKADTQEKRKKTN